MEQITTMFLDYLFPLLFQALLVTPPCCNVEPLLVQSLYANMSFVVSPHMLHLIADSLLSMNWLLFLNFFIGYTA